MSDLLDCRGLADELKKHRSYVTAMRRAGYEFKHIAPNLTTLAHALEWLDANPYFRAFDYQRKGWQSLPKLSKTSKRLPVVDED